LTGNLITKLAKESALTGAQIDVIKLRKLVLSSKITIKEAAMKRSIGPVSLGSYYRVLSQGKAKIIVSIFTILFSIKIGILKIDELERLIELVIKTPDDIDEERSEHIIALIDAVIKKIVML
jgi:hypothetical protein